jgi:hypothetical protein
MPKIFAKRQTLENPPPSSVTVSHLLFVTPNRCATWENGQTDRTHLESDGSDDVQALASHY